MLFVLSPAKALDFDSPLPADAPRPTQPAFAAEAAKLVQVLKAFSPQHLGSLMHLSDTLAALNVARFAAWRARPGTGASRPAVFAFNGDVYGGLQAATLPAPALTWLQQHVRVLSGLYGVLRPLDAMQPYRLEMGTRLATQRGADLYRFWGDQIAANLRKQLAGHAEPVLVNLASQEYFRAVDVKALAAPVVHCVFEDGTPGSYKVVGVLAKRARGLMARFAALNQVQRVQQLHAFDAEGYAYAPDASSAERLVFRRQR